MGLFSSKECPRCNSDVDRIAKCNQCGGSFCKNCAKGLTNKKCPYCGTKGDYSYI